MPKYIAVHDTWLSHECRKVKAGEEFETTFPAGMKLGENIAPAGGKKAAAKPAGDDKKDAEDDKLV